MVGIENADKSGKVLNEGWEAMVNQEQDTVLTTQEACIYLRISRPTYVRYLRMGRIKATKAGKGWRVLKSELDRFLKGDNGDEPFKNASTEDYTGKSDLKRQLNSQRIIKVESGEKDQG